MTPGVMDPRPPYTRFEQRAHEVRDKAGNVSYVDVDYIIVTPQGSKDSVDKVAKEWFPYLKDEVRQGRFPQSWLTAYQEAYTAWKNDQAPPVNGTAIKNWPAASQAEIKILSMLGVVAVEDLAQANEELMARIGMGARSLVQRAKDFITAATDHGPLIARLDALAATNNNLETRIKSLEADKDLLEKRLSASKEFVQQAERAGTPVSVEDLDDRLSSAQAAQPQHREDALVNDALNEAFDG